MSHSLTDTDIERLHAIIAGRRQARVDWSLAEITDSETVVVSVNNKRPSQRGCYHKNHDGEPACITARQAPDWRVHPRDSPAHTMYRSCSYCYPDGDSDSNSEAKP
jgi:hypothetical protein